MAENTIGYIKCTEPSCQEVAEVRKAGGKRQSLYTWCPDCGTNQANGEKRQAYLRENLKASPDDLNVPEDNLIDGYKSDTEETAAIPRENAAHSRLEEVAKVVKAAAAEAEKEPKPKGSDADSFPSTPPPFLFGGLVLMATLIAAVFATRKQQKEQTA
ncbi:hypothetical protein [Marinomonas fungiae]|uniref:hypothetical protein n=1 Tax=Marinomonas fungiae TaxID=1137284 RepID=UPI003A926F0E